MDWTLISALSTASWAVLGAVWAMYKSNEHQLALQREISETRKKIYRLDREIQDLVDPPLSKYVEFDKDLADIGAITPIFVEEVVGLQNYELVREGEPLKVRWVKEGDQPEFADISYKTVPLAEPRVVKETVLRWMPSL